MTVADLRKQRESVAGKGDSSHVPPLPEVLFRESARGRDSAGAADHSPGRDRGAPEDLREGPSGGWQGVSSGLSTSVDLNEELKKTWTSFCGIPAAQVIQDYFLWEAILNERKDLESIVELGTWKGGFSLYLACQARERGLSFRTYDVAPPDREIPGFVQLDIWAQTDTIGEHLERHTPVILLCDNGNKPREVKTFSRYVTDGLIVVHDWRTEFMPEDVPDGLEMVYGDFCEELGSMSRVFQHA